MCIILPVANAEDHRSYLVIEDGNLRIGFRCTS